MPGLPRWLRAHLWLAVVALAVAAAWWQGGMAVGRHGGGESAGRVD